MILQYFLQMQVELNIDLDDVRQFNDYLSEAIIGNTRRYSAIFSDVVLKLLPQYRNPKNPLDVHIEYCVNNNIIVPSALVKRL